jgi:hypothetical protein
MIRDEELRKALLKWEAPLPSAGLDRRVFESCKPARQVSWKLWGAVAAGVAVMLGANLFNRAPQGETPDRTHVETRLAAAGFRPMTDGAITVVKAGAKP